jgi:hypothetical protein
VTDQIPLTHIQFDNQYNGEKARRLADELRRLQAAVNALIGQVNAIVSAGGSDDLADHVLATTTGIGESHTTSGLTPGQVLKAFAVDNARFALLAFAELAQTDPATFVSPAHGQVLQFWNGYYSMRAISLGGLGDPGADALFTWGESINANVWRTLGPGLAFTPGSIEIVEAQITHNELAGLTNGDPHSQYPLHAGTETISGPWTFSARLRVEMGSAAYLDLRDTSQAAGLKQWRLSSEGDLVESLVSDDEATLTDARRVIRTDDAVIEETIYGNDAQQVSTFRGSVVLPDYERRLVLGPSNTLYLTHNADYGRLHCYGQFYVDWEGGLVAHEDTGVDFQTPALLHNGEQVLVGSTAVPSYAVADLPTPGASALILAFAIDGVKVGETTGNGTGTLVYDDGVAWRRTGDDTTVID